MTKNIHRVTEWRDVPPALADPPRLPANVRPMQPCLDDLPVTPPRIPVAPNCGDVVPFNIVHRPAPPPGALPGGDFGSYRTPGLLHINASAMPSIECAVRLRGSLTPLTVGRARKSM